MAVFMLNVCKFNGCGLTFKSLGDLIQHIEETHIDYDPRVVEQTEQQQPTCIPLSYVLRFLTDAARKEATKPVHQSRSNQTCLPQAARNKSNTPTGSEAEEGDDFVSEPEDSNDSWTTSSEFSADFIFRYGSRLNDLPSTTYSHDIRLPNFERVVNENVVTQNNNADKPFACPVPGCKKRYKNVNGIKYHSKNGHKNDGKVRKAFRCPCGKSYKTTYGLKNHTNLRHGSSLLQVKLLHQNNKSLIKYESDYENNMNSRSENISYGNTGSSISKTAKSKVSAIEDHGYIKQERSSVIFNKDSLGILTPASSPPLPLNTSPKIETQPSKSAKEYSSQLHYPIAANNSRYN